ncbi:MAG: radical SAM protein [Candidatus Geothermarchaeales archaeon]
MAGESQISQISKDEASITDLIQTFKRVSDSPLTRLILRNLCKSCRKDGDNHLDVALQLYVGLREDACLTCKIAKRILTPILQSGSKAFGVTKEQLRERFRDPHWRRGLVSVIKGIGWFGVRRPYVPGAPFQIVWNITKACNLRCIHCYENAGLRDADELSREEVHRGIDVLADAGCSILAFSGGEPTIHPHILEFVEHASKRGMYVAMATNAIRLADIDVVREFKEAGLGFAQISLDGLNPETNDYFRGVPGAWRKTVEGIKNCVAEGLFVEVATTATHYNYGEISDLIDFSDELGADWFMIYNFVPTGRGTEIVESDLSPEEREEVLIEAFQKTRELNIEVLSTAPQYARIAQMTESGVLPCESHERSKRGSVIPTHFYNPKYTNEYLKRLADFVGGCGAGRFYLSVEPNGDIYPCVFFPHEEAVRVGNLLEDDFEELWKNSHLLRMLRNKDKLKPNCGTCEYLYTCGGCRARAYNYYGDIRAPDPGCVINNEHWARLRGEPSKRRKARDERRGGIVIQSYG